MSYRVFNPVFALILIALMSTARLDAATISGKITLDNSHSASNAVIYLEGGAASTPLHGAMVDQRNRMFMPHVSVVTVGTQVRFPNDDTVFHNVFAFFHAKKFDLGMYPHGVSKYVTFDKTGVVALQCNIHPDMSAYIMVVDTPYYTVAKSDGSYAIDNVPPGSYTLSVWHESGELFSKPITISGPTTGYDAKLSH